MAQGATEVALSGLDVLGYLDEIPICTAYELDGERTQLFPVTSKLDRWGRVRKHAWLEALHFKHPHT
jgi:adenylosuccinate synthase